MTRKITLAVPEFTGKEKVVTIPIFKDIKTLRGAVRKLDQRCNGIIGDYLKSSNFTPKNGNTFLIRLQIPEAPEHLLLLGLGERAKSTPARIMHAAGCTAQVLGERGFKSCHILMSDVPSGISPSTFLFLFLKGFLLAQYKYSEKSSRSEEKQVENLIIMSTRERRPLAKAVSRAQVMAKYTTEARDMVNAPSNQLTPTEMAKKARAFCKEHDIHCRLLGREDLIKQKMGAIVGVSKGSAQRPRFIIMHYNRDRGRLPIVCLVGKGVTFDSGGISLKSWEHMEEMKGDMAGGAVVMCAVAAAAELKIPLQVVGLIPCVENMPSHSALKPGDVISTHAGKTIEIISTDAEGRLILSDAISYAKTFDPALIVDFATLTGACVIALGKKVAGIMGNNQKCIDLLMEIGKRSGETIWQLPLDDDFSDRVKGDIADYKNYAGRDGSTSTAAALLQHFAGDTPWAHVDIAGPFWSESNSISYLPKGGTGFGVDLAITFLEKLAHDRKILKFLKH